MPLTRRRVTPPAEEESAYKKARKNPLEIYYTLKDAKQALHDIIDQDPGRRVYQIERWNNDFSNTYRNFPVGTFDQICERYILDDDLHPNIMEYCFGDERCPLVFD